MADLPEFRGLRVDMARGWRAWVGRRSLARSVRELSRT
jgi:hypothetical protein